MTARVTMSAVVGAMSLFIIAYRIIALMFPMIRKGYIEKNWVLVLQSFTLLV